MKVVDQTNESLLVDISDALSERDRVRFTVHTRTTLPHFAKPVLSVVRQHEEFIWLHDCLEDNDQYAGYIIPPPPPKPDFDASREKLQRLGDGEANMTKEEFTKMKQELEAEYLAIFKKTVAMHEMFLQRLAAHEKFKDDNNFKIFLEYENELAVRSKSKKEKLAGSIQNIGKSLTDFVITTSQVAATTSATTSLFVGHASSGRQQSTNKQLLAPSNDEQSNSNISNKSNSDILHGNTNPTVTSTAPSTDSNEASSKTNLSSMGDGNNNQRLETNDDDYNIIQDEQYFEKERLFLALYHNSIRDTAMQADRVTQIQKCVANDYLIIAQQLVKLASIEVVPITSQTKDSSTFVSCPLPSLTMPTQPSVTLQTSSIDNYNNPIAGTSSLQQTGGDFKASKVYDDEGGQLGDDYDIDISNSKKGKEKNIKHGPSDKQTFDVKGDLKGGCANDHTSEGLKQLLLNVSDYFEQARKIETRIASDEDLKLTDTFLYYKRDTVAAQDLLVRRLRFMSEYETATRNLEKARQKGRTQMQYADVIQKKAKENFISISKLAKQELIDYKQRRVASFRKAFSDLVDLELKHLRANSQLIMNCLNSCRGIANELEPNKDKTTIPSTSSSTSGLNNREPGAQLTATPSI